MIEAAIMEWSTKNVFLKCQVNHDKSLIDWIFTKWTPSNLLVKNLIKVLSKSLVKCVCFEFKFFLRSIHQFEVIPISDNSGI